MGSFTDFTSVVNTLLEYINSIFMLSNEYPNVYFDKVQIQFRNVSDTSYSFTITLSNTQQSGVSLTIIKGDVYINGSFDVKVLGSYSNFLSRRLDKDLNFIIQLGSILYISKVSKPNQTKYMITSKI